MTLDGPIDRPHTLFMNDAAIKGFRKLADSMLVAGTKIVTDRSASIETRSPRFEVHRVRADGTVEITRGLTYAAACEIASL